MKKTLVFMIVLIAIVTLFTGCSSQNPAPSNTPNNSPSTSAPPIPDPTPKPSPPTTSDNLSIGTGTIEDPFDISAMPDVFEDKQIWWKIGNLGYEPQIICEASSDYYDVVISVPEIPEKLANFAQERGELYIMIVARSKFDNCQEAQLYFYNESMTVMYEESASRVMDGGKTGNINYVFISGDVSLRRMSHLAIIGHKTTVYEDTESNDPYNFTDTSFTVLDEAIDAIINAL